MPHLTLEYTPNATEDSDFTGLFQALHDALVATCGVKIENCKSRAYVARDFYVGSGGEGNGFVHLDIRLLEGRSIETKRAIGQATGRILVEWFKAAAGKPDLQVTVEARDIDREVYFKFPDGTFTPL